MLKAADGFRIMLKVYDSIIEGDTQDCEYDVAVIRDGGALKLWKPRYNIIVTRSNFMHSWT